MTREYSRPLYSGTKLQWKRKQTQTEPYHTEPCRTVPCSGKAPFVSLHWLPVAACIQFKTLMLAYRTTTGSAPTYFHSLITIYIPSRSPAYFHSLLQIYIPSRSLRSASERRLVVPSQRGLKSLSRTFSFTVPGWWNDLQPPAPSGTLDPCQSSSNN